MNKVFLIGNLTRDPELTETSSGVAVVHFSIAVNRNYTDANGEKQTDFFNCTVWRQTAEAVGKYSKKGDKLAVVGSVQMRTYEDNQGVKKTAVDVIAQEVQFLTSKSQRDEEQATRQAYDPNAKGVKRKIGTLQAFDYDDQDIPF